jgi:hypothetical protein
MKSKDLLSYSQNPVTGLYSEADKYSALIVVFPSHLHVCLPSGLLLLDLPLRRCIYFLISYACLIFGPFYPY